MFSRSLCSVVLVFLSPLVFAQEAGGVPQGGEFLDAPAFVPSPVTGEPVEPEITIREEGERVIEEYRVRGTLYMVRVRPQVGPAYYLYDIDGDGMIDTNAPDPANDSVQQWRLIEW